MGQLSGIARHPKRYAPMQETDAVAVSVAHGIEGDARGQPGPRQVTLLAFEDWTAACQHLGTTLPWTLRRANLLVSGVALSQTPGTQVRIGACVLEITGETEPCERMDAQVPGLRLALAPEWRGGRTCRVVQGGTLKLGDAVSIDARAV